MKKLLVGTTNLAKFNDYQQLLKGFNLEIVSLYDLHIEEPEETGKDFEENAVLKAKYYYAKTGIPTLADDGGFEIEALGWAPGVRSHRWLGRKSTDEELINEVYKQLNKTSNPSKKCRMRMVLAIAAPFGTVTSEGAVEGIVADKPSEKRIQGYPFRSVMYFPNYEKYFCDLSKEELEILDHRKAAVEKISDIFKELSK
ncbi:MAG TPA: non-canonical purine NTP pyrophosphatase [Verrucomicrobiae bacterium]|nr:non-canonical purine NTP pyrophosphatase [Verrucomicrobiae bacterium]